ncbi:MAG: carboxypeptidase regulatory-like domain-containing protein [Acidobacteriota bacterium]|nr:carboxypeptidase regulatory-like domain-containing protein [Acidobacteriota bacterium]
MNSILSGKIFRAAGCGFAVCLLALPAMAAHAGRVSGIVLDAAGTPQMGATVLLMRESALSARSLKLLTDGSGRFSSAAIPTGLYTIQVTLAGFLPALDRNVRVNAEHPTVLQIMLGTVFSSLDTLRRTEGEPVSADDWTWVLRSSEATRTVLRWQDASIPLGAIGGVENGGSSRPLRGGVILSSGADRPGSIADSPSSTATAVVYDLDLGARGHLLMAGQFSYDEASSSEGIAGELLPSGGPGTGPVSTILVREARLGRAGPEFRGLRLTHDDQFMMGDRVSVRYGAELLTAGFEGTTTTVRPHGEVAVQITPTWQTSVTVATRPFDDGTEQGEMQMAANALDAFPILLLHRGDPVFEDDLHEELAVQHNLGSRADVAAAVFHDSSNQTAVIGRGDQGGPDFLQDSFSPAFAYDGGSSSSTGARVAYREKLSDDISTTFVYAYAGALAPVSTADVSGPLRNRLTTRYRQSVAGRVSAKISYTHTNLSAGYQWLNGPAVSLQDAYGESLYHVEPYLSMQIRQPLPSAFPCHMEVQADIGNLLAQGYVQVATRDGYVVLVPSYRYIRGGLSLQF